MVVLAFAVGWTGSTLSNGQINRGLVTALNSVLGNLLGETAAGAKIVIVNPEVAPGLQFDVRAYPTIPNAPVVYNLFRDDGDMCKTFAQVRVTEEDGAQMIINPDVLPPNFVAELDWDSGLSEAFPPGPCYPPDPILPPGGDV
jgi:hypothetical protein